MSETRQPEQHEKQEKQNEKEEKERTEKTQEEKWRRDPLSAVIWAIILIWAGLVLLAENMGYLANLGNWEAWNIILIGAGVIVLLEAAVRVLVPTYRRPITGTIIWGVILIAIGGGDRVGWEAIWPVILIIVGVGILLGGFLRRR
jgi:hypothetical protein